MNAQVQKLEALLDRVQRNRRLERAQGFGATAEAARLDSEHPVYDHAPHSDSAASPFGEQTVAVDSTELARSTVPPSADNFEPSPFDAVASPPVEDAFDPMPFGSGPPPDFGPTSSAPPPPAPSADSLFPEVASRPASGRPAGVSVTPIALQEPTWSHGPIAVVVGSVEAPASSFGELLGRSLALRTR
ncbi:MAG: hypothetical protein R3A78_15455 [Polyangiales bacterium]|nr:hypothetical protein [Myxococcales bacterium]